MVDFFTPELQQETGEAGLDEQAPATPYAPSTAGERFEQNIGSVTQDAFEFAKRVSATSQGDYYDRATGDIKHEDAEPNVDQKTLQEKFPGVKGIDQDMPLTVAQSMSDVQARRQKQENILARYPSGAGNAILGFGADLVGGLLDPVADAAFMVPVVGEARYGAWLARAGETAGLTGRAGVTLAVGAARGAGGGAIIAGGEYASGVDPDMTLGDVAQQTLETAAQGALFHGGIDLGKAAFGLPSDILGTRVIHSPDWDKAFNDVMVHDAATRAAAAQIASDQAVEVRPVFDAARMRAQLLGTTAVRAPDPEAATRLDNAVARAAGSPSPAAVALEDEVRTARATPSEKVAEGAEAEAMRQIDAMREQGTLTPEDDHELSALDDELARIDEVQKGAEEGGKPGAEGKGAPEKEAAPPPKPRIIPAPEPVVSHETLGGANPAAGAAPEAAVQGHMEGARLDVLADRQAMPRSSRVTEEIRGMGGIQMVRPDGVPTVGAGDLRQIFGGRKMSGLIDNRRGQPPDRVRETLAERGWFGGNPTDDVASTTVNDLTDMIDKDVNGRPQYHEGRVETQMLRDRQALRSEVNRAGVSRRDSLPVATEKLARFRAENEAEEAEWNTRAKQAALGVPEGAKPEDILTAAIERDGQKAYDAGYGEAYVTQAESWIDERFAHIDPDGYAEFVRDGFGAEPEAPGRNPEGGYEPGADLGSENESGRAGEIPAGAGEPANGEPAEGQRGLDLGPAETDAERQAREGRKTIEESQQLPRAHNGVEQKLADEGLFVPPPERTFFQREAPASAFYSSLTRSVENLKQDRAPASQWRAIIDNLPGVKEGTEAAGERVHLASGLEATLPENVTPQEANVIQRVQDMLKRIAPKADVVTARALESTEGFQQEFGHTGSDHVTGATVLNGTRGLIAWSLESPDALGTARHEVMHFLKDYLHPDEWAALEKASEEQGWQGRFDIAARYPGASPALRMEESAAEALNQWRRAPEWVPESVRPIFEKIGQILGQVAAFLRQTFGGTVTADDVFSRIMSGEVGKRAPMSGREFQGAQTRWSDEPGSPEELEKRRAVLVKQRVTAMQDIAKRDAIMNYVDHARANGLGIAHGITAKMRGISESIEGSRDSTEADMTTNRQRYLGTLMTALEKIPGAQVAWNKRMMTADWTRELFELNRKDGKPGTTKNPLALKIAQAVQASQDLARYEGNKAGAWIGDYEGYIARTAHNPVSIHQAGFEAWRDFTLERLDPAQTFEDLNEDEIEKFMGGTWHALSTGIHLSAADGVSKSQAFQAGRGGNLAQRLSQERVLHFKDADGWREYQQRFGNPDIELGVSQSLMRAGRDVALMKRWGSNPQFSFDKILRDVREKYRSDHGAIEDLRAQEPRLREEFRHLTGEASVPKNDLAYRIISSARGLEDISKLNTVLLAHLSVGATKPYQLQFIGMGRWQAYTAAIRNLVQDKSEAGRATMEALHSNATGQIQQMMHGYEPFADVPGAVAKAQQLAMRLGGLPWLLGRQKAGSTWETANFFGHNVGKPFEALDPKVQRILSLHAISPTEWEALRTAPDHEQDGAGLTYLTPKAADRATPAAIDAIDPGRVEAAGDDEDADRIRQDIRENLAMKLASLYSDTADRSVVTPGIAERALFTRLGGAYGGPLIGQYKTWAAAAVRQMWGQAIYGMERGEAVKALAGLAATMTAMGALRVSIGDALNGKEPDMPNGEAGHDLKLFSSWIVGGGGLGIFGDYVIGAMLRSDTGQDLASNLESAFLGPVAEDVANTAGNLFNLAKAPFSKTSPENKEIKAAGQIFGEFVDHLPVVNTFYVRHVLNWLFLDRLQEMTNPGYLQRYQHAVQERTGQHFYLPPAQSYLGAPQGATQ